MFHGTGKQRILTEFMIIVCKDTSAKRRLLPFAVAQQNCYQTFSSSGVWHPQDAAAF